MVKRFLSAVIVLCILTFVVVLAAMNNGRRSPWRHLEPGLELGIFDAPQKSHVGDSRVTVLRIDPERFSLKLLCRSEHDLPQLTPRQWSRKFGLVAAINAGMYQKDYRTSVGYCVNYDHVNNGRLGKDKTVLAFNRVDTTVPPVQIIDRTCQDFFELKKRYHSFCQSIRMVSCTGRNVWSQQPRKWSTACIGTDRQGNMLLIFCRSPYSVHDFINILKALPLDLDKAMYLDGGPVASLYVAAGEQEKEFFGSYETAVNADNDNSRAWPIPNVIGVARKEER